jgi:23S rRNA G2445 N2-methylase RlmL
LFTEFTMAVRIGLVTAPGIAEVALDELRQRGIKAKDPQICKLKTQELAIVKIESSDVPKLRELRTVEDLFLILLEDVPLESTKDLHRLVPGHLKEKLLTGVGYLADKKRKSGTNYWVFVKQDRDHFVYRRDIAATIGSFIERSFRRWAAREPADVELWVFYLGKTATLGLRLTSISFRQRSYKDLERPGSLRPTLAASLVLLSKPTESDYVIDPMCGVGTILLERGLWGPAKYLGGGDIDEEAVELARSNVGRAHQKIEVVKWDAIDPSAVAAHEGRVTRLICNLPFGKRFGSVDSLATLYKRALQSWQPLLAETGSMTLLTSQGKILQEKAERCHLTVKKTRTIVVQGITTGVFTLRRR